MAQIAQNSSLGGLMGFFDGGHINPFQGQANAQQARAQGLRPGSIIPVDDLDTSRFVTSSMAISVGMQSDVFRGASYITKEKFKKRVEKYRKKHPEEFPECLDIMEKKAYSE